MKTAVNVFFFLSYYLLFTVFYNITIIISYLIIYLFINWFILFFFFHFIPVRTCFICLVIILNLNFITLCKKTTRLFTTNTPKTNLLNISKQPINHLLSQPPPRHHQMSSPSKWLMFISISKNECACVVIVPWVVLPYGICLYSYLL